MRQRVKRLDRHQFRGFWRLPHDRKALGLANCRPFCSPRRFSAGLWGTSRGPQLWQQFVHPATHLLGSRFPLFAFPRMKLPGDQRTCQDHVIVGNGDNGAPALELGRRAQTRLCPQQGLFVKAIPMLLTKAQNISQSDLHDVGVLLSNPNEPTDTGIALFVRRMRTHNADDGQFQPPSPFHMQVVPPGNLDCLPLGILALPMTRWRPMRRFIVGLQFVSILTWCSWLPSTLGSGSVKAAVPFETNQRPFQGQGTPLAPQPRRVVSSVQDAMIGSDSEPAKWDSWAKAI